MDIASIATLLGSIKSATDLAKFVNTSYVSLEKAELKLKLAELIEALASAKLEAVEVQQEIVDRDRRIRDLEAAAAVQAELRWDQPCYFRKNEAGIDEPYCQICYDGQRRLSRLHGDGQGLYQCRVCNEVFKTNQRLSSDRARIEALNARRGDSGF